jgi:hypothetical protein
VAAKQPIKHKQVGQALLLHIVFLVLSRQFTVLEIANLPKIRLLECSVTKNRGFSSVGRASDLHSEGQEFESPSLQDLQLAVIAQLVRARH